MRISFSVDLDEGKPTGPHKFLRRLARAMADQGAELVDGRADVRLRLPHHRRSRSARVDVVRLDGLYLGRSREDRARNRRILRGAKQADGVVFQNAFCREAYARLLGFEPGRWVEVLNGADPAEFMPRSPGRVLLANAAWRGSKRLSTIIDAFTSLVDAGVDAELRVTGEPDQRADHPAIRYLGQVDDARLAAELAQAAASVHLGWLDWCPNAMVEAVVAGCPVIYTDSGGQPAIGRAAGVAVPDAPWDFSPTDQHAPPPLDFQPIVDAMRLALTESIPVDRPDLDITRIAEAYMAFFDELLVEAGAGARPGRRSASTQTRPADDANSGSARTPASATDGLNPAGSAGALSGAADSAANSAAGEPTMHCHAELLRDLEGHTFLSDRTMVRWANEGYSTSRHLLTLYSIARGLSTTRIVEVGVGRSTFVLARAAHENGGTLETCDTSDFRTLLSDDERAVSRYHVGTSESFWPTVEAGVGFAFLDYFSSRRLRVSYIVDQIDLCLSRMLTDGVVAVHDALVPEYRLGRALRALARRPDVELLTLPYCYGLGLIRFTGASAAGRIEDRFVKKAEA